MNSEALQPEVNDAPDQGVHLTTDERLSAVTREAVVEDDDDNGAPLQAEVTEDTEEVGDPVATEAEPEEVEPEAEAEGQQEESVEESEDEVEAQPVGTDWDGDPDNVPSELQPGYERMAKLMNKGVNKRLQQLAEAEKKYNDAKFRYEQAMLDKQQVPQGAPGVIGAEDGPPKPPGEGATADDWTAYEAANAKYYFEKYNAGQAQEVAAMKERQDMQNRLYLITSQDGATDEVMYRMRDMAEADPRWLDKYQSDDGAIEFFNAAKFSLEKEALAAEKADLEKQKAEAVKATAKRKASAAGRATPRPGGNKAASAPEDVFSRKKFRNVDEKMKFFEDDFLNGT